MRRVSSSAAVALCFALVAGCSDDGGSAADARLDRRQPADGGGDADGPRGDSAVDPCPRAPAAADRTRYVVVSHPLAGPGMKSSLLEVLALDSAGALSATNTTFRLGAPVPSGKIVFTPDGEVGYAALESGDIGIFTLDGGGAPTVIDGAYKAASHIDRLVMSPDGKTLYALSVQGRQYGGGIYRHAIQCDGKLGAGTLVAAGDSPYAAQLLGASEAVVFARSLLASKAGDEVHRVSLPSSGTATITASAAAFGDDQAIVESSALTADGRTLLLTDSGLLVGDRVAVVGVGAGALKPLQVLGNIKDPADVVASPWGDVALVLDGEGNSITVLDYDASNASAPISLRGKLSTSTTPLLPVVAVMITRGKLEGRVLVAENVSLRQLQFEGNGVVNDVGSHDFGSGALAIPGALGVQP